MVCPVYQATGHEALSARGKLHLLDIVSFAQNPSANYQDIFANCLLCGACEEICPRGITTPDKIIDAREKFPALYGKGGLKKTIARKALVHPNLLDWLVRAGIQLKALSSIPSGSGLRLKLGLLEDRSDSDFLALEDNSASIPVKTKQISFFTGCFARYLQPSIIRATRTLSAKADGAELDEPSTQKCCGLSAWSAGKKEEARKLAQANIAAFSSCDAPILTSCSSCSSHLRKYPDLFKGDPYWQKQAEAFAARIVEFSEYFSAVTEIETYSSSQAVQLYYHDPCHLKWTEKGRVQGRKIIDSIKNISRVDEGKSFCCGQGGLFHLGYPEVSNRIFQKSAAAVMQKEPDMLISTCSGCLMQWQLGFAAEDSNVIVEHLALLLVRCLPEDKG